MPGVEGDGEAVRHLADPMGLDEVSLVAKSKAAGNRLCSIVGFFLVGLLVFCHVVLVQLLMSPSQT